MGTAFEEIATELQGPRTPLERDAAKALKSLDEAARRIGPIVGDTTRGYLDLLARVLEPPPARDVGPGDAQPAPGSGGGLVLP